jgi:hypothetical protein
MGNLLIFIVEISVTAWLVWVGSSGHKFWLVDSPRSAVITLGVIGFFLCMLSVGKFIQRDPASPLSILGYLFGAAALLTLLVQIFRWPFPVLSNPQLALYVMGASMVVKALIGRFGVFLLR